MLYEYTVFSPVCWIQLPSCTICGVGTCNDHIIIIIRVIFLIELCPSISFELAYRMLDIEFQVGILK